MPVRPACACPSCPYSLFPQPCAASSDIYLLDRFIYEERTMPEDSNHLKPQDGMSRIAPV